MKVLGIETSCDETSASVYDGDVFSNIVHTQISHREYGGIVPEIASRDHLRKIQDIVNLALKTADIDIPRIDGVAATCCPGLIGSLLIGLTFAKSIAYALSKPFIAINHIEGHIFSTLIGKKDVSFPRLYLLVSGGHTEIILVQQLGRYKVLGSTVDDAAGEAFDKVAKLIGLGYPGGPAIEKAAKKGNKRKFHFPRPDPGGLNFSFSGLKTAVLYQYQSLSNEDKISYINDISASFQDAVIDTLVAKLERASQYTGIKRVGVCGGVSANRRFQERVRGKFQDVIFPEKDYTSDNGAMIAAAGYFHLMRGETSQLSIRASGTA